MAAVLSSAYAPLVHGTEISPSALSQKTRPLSCRQDGQGTLVKLSMGPQEAGFVVFRQPSSVRAFEAPVTSIRASVALDGAWEVAFEAKRGAPGTARFPGLIDWTQSADLGIRYFSGAAIYSRKISVDPRWLEGGRVILDLGDVRESAVVSIDGRMIATPWTAPFRIDLTSVMTR